MHAQRGFSLLETMIAGAVASLGLSGVAALLIASVSGTAGSGYRTQALDLAIQMAETMRLAPAQESVYLAPPPVVAPPCGPGDGCDTAQFAASNSHGWHLRVGLSLPTGVGMICRDATPDDGGADAPACDGIGEVVVKLFWVEPDGEQRLVLEAGS
jgi:type IV pilus assembly protein PilV